MPPPSYTPVTPVPVSPPLNAIARDGHSTSTAHVRRQAYLSHSNLDYSTQSLQSPCLSNTRSLDAPVSMVNVPSNASFGSPTSAMNLDISPRSASISQHAPTFENTRVLQTIIDPKGSQVQPELQARIDKGFFKSEDDWTCYRRNYFAVACAYNLKPQHVPATDSLYLHVARTGESQPIQSLAMSITAKVEGEEGKTIELVQHTPKRDRGPLGRPDKIKLMPHMGPLGSYPDTMRGFSPNSQHSSDFDPIYAASPPAQQQNQTIATFDRIQFKNATANNGKRRAHQQYFRVVVELWAETPSNSSEAGWIKVASRMSAPMVVRGRSPGHYSDDRRGSSGNMGPGGGSSDGAGDSSAPGPSSNLNSGPAGTAYPSNSRNGSGGYQPQQGTQKHVPSGRHSTSSSYASTDEGVLHATNSAELTKEEANAFDTYPGYQYYPSPLFEVSANNQMARPPLAPMRTSAMKQTPGPMSSQEKNPFGYITASSGPDEMDVDSVGSGKPNVKFEPRPGYGSLPSPKSFEQWHSSSAGNNTIPTRHCGRFEGVPSSRGYYPEAPPL